MTSSVFKLVIALLKNGLRFQYMQCTGKPGRPQAISLEITHRCIARCRMCNIWKIRPEAPELSTGDWLDLLSSDLLGDLRELDITGGEPFLREDLTDLFSGICARKHKNLTSLQSVVIPSNGLLTKRVLECTEDIVRMLANEGL